jgi:hypothetical protein
MRLIFWGLFVVALGYAAYSGMIAAWSWLAVNNAVDEIISREGADALPPQEIRTRVMQATGEAGIPLREKDIVVTREPRGVRVEIMWTVPVIVLRDETLLAVPLSVKRATAR